MHSLRHTFANLLFEQNKNIQHQGVKYLMGHKNVQITLDIYTSITKKQKKRLVKVSQLSWHLIIFTYFQVIQ